MIVSRKKTKKTIIVIGATVALLFGCPRGKRMPRRKGILILRTEITSRLGDTDIVHLI